MFDNWINFGYAASMAFVLFWIIFGETIVQRRFIEGIGSTGIRG